MSRMSIYPSNIMEYKVDVPEGRWDPWSVERFQVDEAGANRHNLYEKIHHTFRMIEPGTYTKLVRNGTIVMSDTPSEIYDHLDAIRNAKGHVLIAGLGLGMVTGACLKSQAVERVTVIEKSPVVIHLVAGHYKKLYGDRLEIVESDIMDYKAPKGLKYGSCWFDIWDHICSDNLEPMKALKARYGRKSEWVGCWAEAECRQRARMGW